ncbi:DUF1127 domain-containing protein [Bosea sp. Root483D1]|uniref:DUF1127 domain-containing protein n=1 Tax=Bosea sp. Root483D1 TaxID=1736544 RepID=UPI000A4A90EA|nr:DUF1127 domain-containing protein [Bosea sp. Root483D1]
MNDTPASLLRCILATWHERIRARWKLTQMVRENPHLLNDIGLTRQQVETEIAKRFWQR